MSPNPKTTVPTRRLWRQGDIYIQEFPSLPEGCSRMKGGVIARGEATGHAHRLSSTRGAKLYLAAQPKPNERPIKPGLIYLEVSVPECAIEHQEHASIRLTTGVYEIWRQREFDATHGGFRMSAD